ncbi:hypothetical protein ACIRPQ_29060 [Streptomyces sp. NPDC101213]|uniref:hypothetical protein n=1 Tax=Streptomyces sp. NPDC101213 TaxID=3366130 RepID=UPI0038075B1B
MPPGEVTGTTTAATGQALQREQAFEAATALYERVTQLLTRVMPVMQQLAEQAAALARQLQDAGYLDEDLKPAHRRGVAAQHSPYGPSRKRSRHP